MQLIDTVGKGCDGFFLNQLFHHLIPYHKVSGASVLVDEQQLRPAVNRFHNVRRLRGRAGGVLGREICRFTPGEPLDKGRNVHMLHTPSVFCRNADSAAVSDAQFPSVTQNMVVNTGRDGIQQGGFTGVAATSDHCDTLFNAHTPDTTDFDLVLRSGLERNSVLEW